MAVGHREQLGYGVVGDCFPSPLVKGPVFSFANLFLKGVFDDGEEGIELFLGK